MLEPQYFGHLCISSPKYAKFWNFDPFFNKIATFLPPWSPYQGHWGPSAVPRPLAEFVWYHLHSRKYLQPKKIVKPLSLQVDMLLHPDTLSWLRANLSLLLRIASKWVQIWTQKLIKLSRIDMQNAFSEFDNCLKNIVARLIDCCLTSSVGRYKI
jgi:hypothetical protein